MKPASPELIALLATRQFQFCELFQFDLVGGSSLYYCTADADISYGGNTYLAGKSTGPYFERDGEKAKVHWKRGLEVDTLTFDVLPGSSTVNGKPFLSAVRKGVFDGADLTFLHAYWPLQAYTPLIVPTGAVTMFAGSVADVDAGRSSARFTINSHTEKLNQNLPRNLYQSGCVNTLYDASCTLNSAAFAVSGTALTGSTASVISATLAQATGYFDLGKITFTSGDNNGVSRSVKGYTNGSPGTISLISPFPSAPADGDTFTIYPGCNKTRSVCQSKFSNSANFRGVPLIPSNETSV